MGGILIILFCIIHLKFSFEKSSLDDEIICHQHQGNHDHSFSALGPLRNLELRS